MSQESIDITRRGIEQFNRQFTSTEELDLDFVAPDAVLDNSNAAFDAAVYRGHDGVREYMAWVRGMWQLQQLEAREFVPVDEHRVIVALRMVSVGRDGVEIAAHAALLATVGDGKITHLKAFQTKADALDAVGLSEQR
jgi:ketosteroid isomerase-like protein